MGAQLGNLGNVLQINYGDWAYSQTNDRTNIWRSLPMNREFDGLEIQENVVGGYPATGGGVGPGGSFIAAGNSQSFITKIWHAYLAYSIEIDIDLMKQSNGRHRFVRATTLEVDRMRKFAQLDVERMACQDGSGRLADLSGSESGTAAAYTAPDAAMAKDTTDPWWFEVPNWRAVFFVPGMLIQVWNNNTSAGTQQLSSGNKYLTVDKVLIDGGFTNGHALIVGASGETFGGVGYAAPTAGHVVKKYLACVKPSSVVYSNEVQGLKGIISSGAPPIQQNTKAGTPSSGKFQEIDPSSVGFWQSTELDAAGAEISEGLLEDLARNISIYGAEGPENIKFYATHQEQVSLLRKGKYPLERIPLTSGASPDLPLGFSSSADEEQLLRFAGKPIRVSRFIDNDRFYAFPEGDMISRYELGKMEFISGDGSMWHRNFAGRLSYGAEAIYFCQMGAVARNTAGVIKNLKTIS